MKTTYRKTLIAATLIALCGTAFAQSTAEHPTTPPPAHEKQSPAVEQHLHTFDVLDVEGQGLRPRHHHQDPPDPFWFGFMDGGYRRDDRDVYQTDAPARWQVDPAHRQALRHRHGHHRALERQDDGRRMAVLGQPGLHEPAWPG